MKFIDALDKQYAIDLQQEIIRYLIKENSKLKSKVAELESARKDSAPCVHDWVGGSGIGVCRKCGKVCIQGVSDYYLQ